MRERECLWEEQRFGMRYKRKTKKKMVSTLLYRHGYHEVVVSNDNSVLTYIYKQLAVT